MIRLMWWSRRVTDGVTDGVTDVLTGGVTDSVTDGAFWLWRLMDGSVRRLLPAKRSVPVTSSGRRKNRPSHRASPAF